MKENRSREEEFKETEANILMVEFEKMRDEMVHHINTMGQSLLLSLGSASFAIPFLATATKTLPQDLIIIGLYFLAVIYAVIGMRYSTAAYYVNAEGYYIRKYLSLRLNKLLKTGASNRVLYWEEFSRMRKGRFIESFISSIGPFGEGLLLILPSFLAILAAKYVALLPHTPTTQPEVAQFISVINTPLVIAAWLCSSLSVVAHIMNLVYAYSIGYMSPKDTIQD